MHTVNNYINNVINVINRTTDYIHTVINYMHNVNNYIVNVINVRNRTTD